MEDDKNPGISSMLIDRAYKMMNSNSYTLWKVLQEKISNNWFHNVLLDRGRNHMYSIDYDPIDDILPQLNKIVIRDKPDKVEFLAGDNAQFIRYVIDTYEEKMKLCWESSYKRDRFWEQFFRNDDNWQMLLSKKGSELGSLPSDQHSNINMKDVENSIDVHQLLDKQNKSQADMNDNIDVEKYEQVEYKTTNKIEDTILSNLQDISDCKRRFKLLENELKNTKSDLMAANSKTIVLEARIDIIGKYIKDILSKVGNEVEGNSFEKAFSNLRKLDAKDLQTQGIDKLILNKKSELLAKLVLHTTTFTKGVNKSTNTTTEEYEDIPTKDLDLFADIIVRSKTVRARKDSVTSRIKEDRSRASISKAQISRAGNGIQQSSGYVRKKEKAETLTNNLGLSAKLEETSSKISGKQQNYNTVSSNQSRIIRKGKEQQTSSINESATKNKSGVNNQVRESKSIQDKFVQKGTAEGRNLDSPRGKNSRKQSIFDPRESAERRNLLAKITTPKAREELNVEENNEILTKEEASHRSPSLDKITDKSYQDDIENKEFQVEKGKDMYQVGLASADTKLLLTKMLINNQNKPTDNLVNKIDSKETKRPRFSKAKRAGHQEKSHSGRRDLSEGVSSFEKGKKEDERNFFDPPSAHSQRMFDSIERDSQEYNRNNPRKQVSQRIRDISQNRKMSLISSKPHHFVSNKEEDMGRKTSSHAFKMGQMHDSKVRSPPLSPTSYKKESDNKKNTHLITGLQIYNKTGKKGDQNVEIQTESIRLESPTSPGKKSRRKNNQVEEESSDDQIHTESDDAQEETEGRKHKDPLVELPKVIIKKRYIKKKPVQLNFYMQDTIVIARAQDQKMGMYLKITPNVKLNKQHSGTAFAHMKHLYDPDRHVFMYLSRLKGARDHGQIEERLKQLLLEKSAEVDRMKSRISLRRALSWRKQRLHVSHAGRRRTFQAHPLCKIEE